MIEHVVVALIVAAAACYAVWTLVPAVRRAFGRADRGGCGGCASCETARPADTVPAVREAPIRIVRTTRGSVGRGSVKR